MPESELTRVSMSLEENLLKAFGNSLLVMENGAMLVDECCPPGEEHQHEPETDGMFE